MVHVCICLVNITASLWQALYNNPEISIRHLAWLLTYSRWWKMLGDDKEKGPRGEVHRWYGVWTGMEIAQQMFQKLPKAFQGERIAHAKVWSGETVWWILRTLLQFWSIQVSPSKSRKGQRVVEWHSFTFACGKYLLFTFFSGSGPFE